MVRRRHRRCDARHADQGSGLISRPATAEAPDASDIAHGNLVDTADIPGGGVLRLMRFGADFSIQFCGDELMGSDMNGSEKIIATETCRRLGDRADRVLIGGLGMGFTLGAAQAALPSSAGIVVAELVPKVVAWARGPLAHLFGGDLDDPRVSIEVADVHDVIVDSPGGYDGIMLDVDNGPDGFIQLANERLYCSWGLRAAHAALRPGGLLAIWSAYDDDAFVERLEGAGFVVDEMKMRANGGRTGPRHTIWFATRLEV